MFNIVESPSDELVLVITYIVPYLASFFFLFLDVNKATKKCSLTCYQETGKGKVLCSKEAPFMKINSFHM